MINIVVSFHLLLNNNYQYKAFGIPWLGFKRGLADDIVVSSYGEDYIIPKEYFNLLEFNKINKKYIYIHLYWMVYITYEN